MTVTGERKSLKYIPDDLKFYQHQIDGVRELAKRGSMILGDDMGLGKSLQALTVFAVDVEMGWADKMLIVCPASLKVNWLDEITERTHFHNVLVLGEEFNEDTEQWKTVSANKRAMQITMFEQVMHSPKIMICNYEQVTRHLDDFNRIGFDMVVYDEAHLIANPRAIRTKSCLKLQGKRHMPATGSVMRNDASDVWTLLNRVNPKEFDNYWKFRKRYCVFGGFKGKEIIGVQHEGELTRLLNENMLRRLKDDVLDLPEKQYITVKVGLTAKQKELYDQVVDNMTLPDADDADPEQILNALHAFTRLKQICATTATIEGYEDESEKLDRVVADTIELIDGGHKAVIFTQFRPVIAALEARLTVRGIPLWQIHGDVPKGDRTGIVRTWEAFPHPAPIICMHQVGGVGLNMTAARHMLLVDRLFVPKDNEQSEDRIYRIGADKTQPVQYRDYLCIGTKEERVNQILRKKTKLFDAIVEKGNLRREIYRALKEA